MRTQKIIDDQPAEGRREERRLAIIAAAESLFCEQGYERASLAAIVRRSGGSLATVYELFGNKQGLLRAVVERIRADMLGAAGDIACDGGSAAAALTAFAHRVHAHMMSPRVIAMMRVIIAEALRDPEFAHAFHEDVHLSFMREIAGAFRRWNADGRAGIDDPDAAAELLFASVICDADLKAMIGLEPDLADSARIDWRLAPFLAHFSIR